jgi:hypothetical protein
MGTKKQDPVSDSADLLALRQSKLLTFLVEGIQRGGLSDEEWLQVYIIERRLSDRGFISPRMRQVMNIFLEYRLYRVPVRLVQLVKRMEAEFDLIQRLYTQKNLLSLHKIRGGEEIVSTLQVPLEFKDSIGEIVD